MKIHSIIDPWGDPLVYHGEIKSIAKYTSPRGFEVWCGESDDTYIYGFEYDGTAYVFHHQDLSVIFRFSPPFTTREEAEAAGISFSDEYEIPQALYKNVIWKAAEAHKHPMEKNVDIDWFHQIKKRSRKI